MYKVWPTQTFRRFTPPIYIRYRKSRVVQNKNNDISMTTCAQPSHAALPLLHIIHLGCAVPCQPSSPLQKAKQMLTLNTLEVSCGREFWPVDMSVPEFLRGEIICRDERVSEKGRARERGEGV